MHEAFEIKRKNMVERQLLPNGIKDEALLSVLRSVPREKFVPPLMQTVAYLDNVVPLGNGSFVPEPMALARMIQALQLGRKDLVLDIGCSSGYSTAVMAGLANMVVGIDANKMLTDAANKQMLALEISNTAIIYQGNLGQGYPEQGPYDAILINGTIAEIPLALKNQLKPGGRLIAVVAGGRSGGTAVIVKRTDNGFDTAPLFDIGLPILQNFSVKEGFKFA